MSDGQVAAADRLPWLADEPAPAARSAARRPRPHSKPSTFGSLAGWAVAAIIAVALAAYWFGSVSGDREAPQQVEVRDPGTREATVKLPEPRQATPPQVSIPPAPEVNPSPAPQVKVPELRVTSGPPRKSASVRADRPETSESSTSPSSDEETAKAVSADSAVDTLLAKERSAASKDAARVTPSEPLVRWPSRVTKGASGRLVQIGAFGSRQQAKLGWRRMQRAYPAVGRLPAVVVEARNSRGRRFYRLQIGTTSQAHSEVLCQRMEKIRFSCAVVGLSWKAKVER